MQKIFRLLASRWKTCLVIFALLLLQAWCDLSLPGYTSDIVDVGIQMGGIESTVPHTVRADTLQALEWLMPQEDAAQAEAAFSPADENGLRTLTAGADRAALEELFSTPDMVLYAMAAGQGQEPAPGLDGAVQTVNALPARLQTAAAQLRQAAAAERVFEFLAEPEEDQHAAGTPADPALINGQVTFDHVRFGYTPDKTIIRDFSCTVQPGQKVAIVGPTGAGKTTIVKLLMRFYDVDAGRILLNGHDVREFDCSPMREGFGMVLQDTWLFQGTIMENIRYGRLDATDEEVIAAARAAKADHFIRTLPGGYNMVINEEASNVSQGQKQLLTIARAILADNRILILDEATSSVDTRTEEQIQTAMDNLMRGRTSFVIAHRLSTIKDSDLILVMRDGGIVEQGTHDQLLEAGGFYADLYNSQFEDVSV